MVKTLISEDDPVKLNEIVEFVKSLDVPPRSILTEKTLIEFSDKLDTDIDICIIDIRIPAFEGGGDPDQNGLGILQKLENSSNGQVKLLAISAFPEEFEDIRSKFERQGCVLANYHERDVWQNALRILLLQSSAQTTFDFLIFAALQKERTPYLAFEHLNGRALMKDGFTRYDIEIGGKSGSIIELPRMGLVNAAITAAMCIDRYSPSLIAMSGICAGFPGKANLGQLLIAELAYEYQTGKWSKDGFKQEPYQIPMSEALRTLIRHLLDNENLAYELEEGWKEQRPSSATQPSLAVFTSGSAVIADSKFLEQVSDHHRKVSGLDMEVYALHRATHLSRSRPDVLCAKVVVDLANEEKDDKIQNYGCYVSSRFVVKAVEAYFKDQC